MTWMIFLPLLDIFFFEEEMGKHAYKSGHKKIKISIQEIESPWSCLGLVHSTGHQGFCHDSITIISTLVSRVQS